ncbi:oligosaccharide flippase family protein [uncultured Winogradskyella sp.]|uniref:lipopolysaccharide biosynthesis protein n=1 Tax=uncultured Winogradskyella sp. TaxID=395353 RepID=UPI00261B7698|nr:oligosaccharide flippase family protein [uncultured Winogradskyella sp.]
MNFLKTKNPFKSTLLFGVFSVLRSGISLLLLPIFLNYLSPEDYGIVSLVLIYSGIIAVIGSLGLKNALYTFYFDFNKKDRLREYLSNLFIVHLLSFFLITCIHILFGNNIYELIFTSNEVSFYDYGLIALLSVFFEVINKLYFVFLKNEINLKIYLRYTLCLIILTAFFQIIFVTQYNLKAYGLLLGALIPNIIIFVLISISNTYLFRFKLKKKLLYPSLNYSLKLLPFLLFFAFENQIDKYLIELNLGLKSVGLYTLLIKLLGLLIISLNAVDDGIRPFVYRDLKEGKATVNKYFNLYIGFGILVLTLVNTLGYNLEYIIKNTEYLVIKDYIFTGSIVFLLVIPVRFYGLLLVYYKESLKLSSVTFIKVIIMILLMIFLIPKYKLYGALYALSISYVINIAMFTYFLFKKVNLLPNKKTLVYILIFILGSYFINTYYIQEVLFTIIYMIISIGFFVFFYIKDGYTILK